MRTADTMSQSRLAAVAGASWLALIASTSLGARGLDHVQARIQAAPEFKLIKEARYRLVVQSYAADSLGVEERPTGRTFPLSAAQREVSPDELTQGVEFDLLQVGVKTDAADAIIVAWIEPGTADLAYDGLEARPGAHALWGRASRELGQPVELVLRDEFVRH